MHLLPSHNTQPDARGPRHTLIPIGLVGALIAAVAFPLATSRTVQLAVVIGLLGVIATFSLDHFLEFLSRVEVENELQPLLGAVEKCPALATTLGAIATNAIKITDNSNHPAFVERLMRAKLEDADNHLKGLDAGTAVEPAHGVAPMSQLMELVNKSVMATTIPESDDEWWCSDEGMEYLRLNERAAKDRNVRIERVVLWKEISAQLARVVAAQRKAGVFLSFAPYASAELNTNLAIYDGQIYHEVKYNADRKPISYEYVDLPDRVKEKVRKFQELATTEDLPPGLEGKMREMGLDTP